MPAACLSAFPESGNGFDKEELLVDLKLQVNFGKKGHPVSGEFDEIFCEFFDEFIFFEDAGFD